MLPPRYWEEPASELLRKAEAEVRENVLPLIPDFEDFSVHAVKGIRHMGKYVANSHKKPVVVVSQSACAKAGDKYDVDLYTCYLTTILHELGHAIQEARGKRLDEDEAESVAHTYWSFGQLPKWVTAKRKVKR